MRTPKYGRRAHRLNVPTDELEMLRRSYIAEDIRRLLSLFISGCLADQSRCSFAWFKQNCWDELDFKTIHFVCIQKDARYIFINEVFAHLMKYLLFKKSAQDPVHVFAQLGAMFGLYLVYYTQPTSSKITRYQRYPIRLPINQCPQFSSTLTWLEQISEHARAVIAHLRQLNAFLVVAHDEAIDELMFYMKEFDSTGVFPCPDALNRQKPAPDSIEAVERKLIESWISGESKSILADIENFNMASSEAMKEYMQLKMEAMEHYSQNNGIDLLNQQQLSFDPHQAPTSIIPAIKQMQSHFHDTFIKRHRPVGELNTQEEDDELGLPSFEDIIAQVRADVDDNMDFDDEDDDEDDLEESYRDLMNFLDDVDR